MNEAVQHYGLRALLAPSPVCGHGEPLQRGNQQAHAAQVLRTLWVRRDPVQLVKHIVEASKDPVQLYPVDGRDEHGQRIYAGFKNSDRWRRVQARNRSVDSVVERPAATSFAKVLQLSVPRHTQAQVGRVPILWLALWSDKAILPKTARVNVHPVYLAVSASLHNAAPLISCSSHARPSGNRW